MVVLFALVTLCRSKVPETDRVGSLRGSGRIEEGNNLSLPLEPSPMRPKKGRLPFKEADLIVVHQLLISLSLVPVSAYRIGYHDTEFSAFLSLFGEVLGRLRIGHDLFFAVIYYL